MSPEHAVPEDPNDWARERAEEEAEVRRLLTLTPAAAKRIALAQRAHACAVAGQRRCAWAHFLHWAALSVVPLARYRLRHLRADWALRRLKHKGHGV